MERDLEYEDNNIAFDCQYIEEEGGGIKCKNYKVCETVLPRWWFSCKNNYLCTSCHMLFGTWGDQSGKRILKISDNAECPICLENKCSVEQPRCKHTLCIDCFKRCYYGDDNAENEPTFPYPDIEYEYYEDQDNPKWDTDFPLIHIYNIQWDKWDDDKNEKRNNEEYLCKCPLCRK